MTALIDMTIAEMSLDSVPETTGTLVVFVSETGTLDPAARRVNRLTRGAVQRVVDADGFDGRKTGECVALNHPIGVAADRVLVVKLPRKVGANDARVAGANIAKARAKGPMTVLAGAHSQAAVIAQGIVLRSYNFVPHKTGDQDMPGDVTLMVTKPDEVSAAYADMKAAAEGVVFTRDLTNEPANILTTTEFANRLVALTELGVQVQVLDEAELEELGMRTLLCVGQGSRSPSKVVVMEWNGGGDEAPFALVGKGVVFDTGGISIKPAAGMEDMTMDMGGAGVVSGVMKTLALRKAKANVVGLVGLVENMPDGNATRPGDVIRSMKGDTVEVINTDAEGRLVLADVLWYAQERFKPCGMINLATLTGAVIIGLGHENAGVFSNSDKLSGQFLAAATAEDEGAWRMPMGPGYDKLLKSRIADMKNIGGRAGGSITAAQFLKRFVKDETPWAHLDIAGVALIPAETPLAPAGATGWGVRALDRLIRTNYEG